MAVLVDIRPNRGHHNASHAYGLHICAGSWWNSWRRDVACLFDTELCSRSHWILQRDVGSPGCDS